MTDSAGVQDDVTALDRMSEERQFRMIQAADRVAAWVVAYQRAGFTRTEAFKIVTSMINGRGL